MHSYFKRSIRYLSFIKDFIKFSSMNADSQRYLQLSWRDRYPCLRDKTGSSPFDGHYIYHTAWAARILAKAKPVSHVDISSSLYFCSIVSAFIPVSFHDYRPANLHLSNLSAKSADLSALPFADDSIHSLSCMHVIEHVGLGRYGDQLDPSGDLQAIAELKRVLDIGGSLLFVVPIGKPMIAFNAHRIYSFDQIVSYFTELDLLEFALIPDNHEKCGLINNATKEMADAQSYGCGCFWFKKTN